MSTFGGWSDPYLSDVDHESLLRMMEDFWRDWSYPETESPYRPYGRHPAEELTGTGPPSAALPPSTTTGTLIPQSYRYRPNPIKMDFIESPDAIIVIAEMPGFSKESIHVYCDENNNLEVSGERKEERITQPGENVSRKELQYGSFKRAMRLPSFADPKNVQTEYKNGMLGIKFGRRPIPGTQQILIQ